MTKKYKAYLATKKFKKISFAVKKRDNFKCVKCGSKKNLHAHHLNYKNIYNEEDHLDVLITVCAFCHKYKCHQDKTMIKYINKAIAAVYILLAIVITVRTT